MAKLEYSVWQMSGLDMIRVQVNANFGPNAQARVYIDGGAPSAWTPLLLSGGFRYNNFLGLADGFYRVDYKDDINGEMILCKIPKMDIADTCFSEGTGFTFIVAIQSDKILIVFDPGLIIGDTIPEAQTKFQREISIDGGVTWKLGVYSDETQTNTSWTNEEMASLGVTPIVPNLMVRRLSNACTEQYATDVNTLEAASFDPLHVEGIHTNVTAPGADDGSITLDVTGGSGNYSFEWADGPIIQNRINLPVGFYTVVVTDDETLESEELTFQILGPDAPPSNLGTIFQIPMMNSLHFVVDPIIPDHDENMQTPDNTLFRNQFFPGFKKGEYYQKVIKSDRPSTQFYSNYPEHTAGLYDFCTNEFVKSFPIVLTQQNIGATETFPINIRNYAGNPGKSRVLFNVGTPPLPVAVGDSFEIVDNGNGFNGSYIIQEVIYDSSLGYPFIVINLNYTAPGVSAAANGIFAANTVDFNVYEVVKDMSDVPDGYYYVKITATDSLPTVREGISEPIDLQLTHPKTNLIEYWNIDNAFDITWTTGYKGAIRVESLWFKRNPGGERAVSRDSDFSLVKLSAKKQRIFVFQTFMLPPYLHEKLSVLFDMDKIILNRSVEISTSEGYDSPDYLDRFMLANSQINIEQVGWFDKYNSNDIGTIAEGNFLAAEGDDSLIKI